jgi:hypothetical protein
MTTFNRVRVFIVAGAVLSSLNVLAGVAQNREPSFDVASIRPNKSGDTGSGSKRDPGRVTIYNTTLREMVRQASDWRRKAREGKRRESVLQHFPREGDDSWDRHINGAVG